MELLDKDPYKKSVGFAILNWVLGILLAADLLWCFC